MKHIILCADDYAQNPAITQAILSLLGKERLSAVSCMTDVPGWGVAASSLLPFKGKIDIGLHFNLTEGAANKLSLETLLIKTFFRKVDQSEIESQLMSQLELFESRLGFLPDFIDGHEHVHHLPVLRDALFSVYERVFSKTSQKPYVRSVSREITSFKEAIIQLTGGFYFKNQLVKRKIPHNASFSGFYDFKKDYRSAFLRFLSQSADHGLIMCHPGIGSVDSIGLGRQREYDYLASSLFIEDLEKAGVALSRFCQESVGSH